MSYHVDYTQDVAHDKWNPFVSSKQYKINGKKVPIT